MTTENNVNRFHLGLSAPGRVFLLPLASVLVAMLAVAPALSQTSDALPSWSGEPRAAIIEFVNRHETMYREKSSSTVDR